MPRNQKLQLKWEQQVKDRYKQLRDKKDMGVAVHPPEWCIKKVAEEFLREPSTIEAIVYGGYDARRERNRKKLEDKDQLNLFGDDDNS